MDFTDKNSKLSSYLTCRRGRIALTILHFNKITNFDATAAIMSNEMNNFSTGNYYFASNKKMLQEKTNKLIKALIQSQQSVIFGKLRKVQQKTREASANKLKLK